jgi:hypothetical protein
MNLGCRIDTTTDRRRSVEMAAVQRITAGIATSNPARTTAGRDTHRESGRTSRPAAAGPPTARGAWPHRGRPSPRADALRRGHTVDGSPDRSAEHFVYQHVLQRIVTARATAGATATKTGTYRDGGRHPHRSGVADPVDQHRCRKLGRCVGRSRPVAADGDIENGVLRRVEYPLITCGH